MYGSAITFIAACGVYAAYSFFSIRGLTAFWPWHVTQWIACALFIAAGFLFGYWWKRKFNFHDFGRIVAVALFGVAVYVFGLHWLLDTFRGV